MGSLALSEVRGLDGRLLLTVTGAVNDATVESFERALDQATAARSYTVIVDLSRCQLDSAGLAALVRLYRRSIVRAAETRLVVPNVALFRMLEIVGLASQFPTYRTMAAAVHSLPSSPSPATRLPGLAAMRRHLRRPVPLAGEPIRPWRHSSPDGPGSRGTSLPRRPTRFANRPAGIETHTGEAAGP
jgi:anti-anti-sigma factor